MFGQRQKPLDVEHVGSEACPFGVSIMHLTRGTRVCMSLASANAVANVVRMLAQRRCAFGVSMYVRGEHFPYSVAGVGVAHSVGTCNAHQVALGACCALRRGMRESMPHVMPIPTLAGVPYVSVRMNL